MADKWFIRGEAGGERVVTGPEDGQSYGIGFGGFSAAALLAWAVVIIPLAWGVYVTLLAAAKIFQ